MGMSEPKFKEIAGSNVTLDVGNELLATLYVDGVAVFLTPVEALKVIALLQESLA
jgi:hypothetical protein